MRLTPIEGSLDKSVTKQFHDMIHFTMTNETHEVNIAEQLSVKLLEDFGTPTHFIEFGDNKYVAVAVEDFELKVIVHRGIIKCGIIPLRRRSLHGVKMR